MVSEVNNSPTGSEASASLSLKDLVTRDGLVGLILCAIACGLALYGFWRLGEGGGDMIAVTDYVTEVPAGRKVTFGYGGVRQAADSQSGEYQHADVPFQSRVMSPFSFSIARGEDGIYWVESENDRLLVGSEDVDIGKRIQLDDRARLKVVGRYGSASFTAHLDEQQGRVRLRLNSPIYYPLSSGSTRLSFGLASETVGAPVDEVVVRTRLRGSQAETFIVKRLEGGGFHLKQEEDLSRAGTAQSEVLTEIGNPDGQPAGEASVNSGDSIRVGTVLVKFSGNNRAGLLGSAPTWVFGLKLAAVVFLLAIVFGLPGLGMHDTQVRLPHGPVIFGCVVVFATVGLILAARDYFLPPYDQGRFPEYLKWFFVSVVILYLIRIPLDSFSQWRWAYSFIVFLLVYILLGRPFDDLFFIPLFEFAVAFFLGATAVHWIMRSVRGAAEYLVDADWLRVLLLGVLLPIAGIMFVTFLAGGRSALNVFGVRFHLPTALTLLVTFGTVLAVTVAENENSAGWRRHRTIALASMLGVVGLYYLLSSFDHGGTILIGVAAIAAMWATSRRDRPWVFTAVLAALIVGVLYLAVVVGQERIDIAWGGEEGAERYFDQAVNLRTARDLARAGGWFGLYDQLYVPSSVSMNIYNDLVTAYIAGFFGLLGLLLVAVCYYLFYTRLLDGTLALMSRKAQESEVKVGSLAPAGAWPDMPSPYADLPVKREGEAASDPEAMRHMLAAFALSLIAVFLFQLLWVFTATLWRRVPISGLDLQPISASVISIVAFIVILLGSVAFVHNASRSQGGAQMSKS